MNQIGGAILAVFIIIVIYLAFGKHLFSLTNQTIQIVNDTLGFQSPSGLYGEVPHSTIPDNVEIRTGGPILTRPDIPVNEEYFGELDYADRSISNINRIVLHHTGDSSASQTISALKEKGLSVHYVVDKDGTIYYLVDETKTAFHCGCCRPTDAYCLNKYKNPPRCLDEKPPATNFDSIGIEIVNTGKYSDQYTDEQYTAIKNLLSDIASRWGIPLDNTHVLGHYEITQGKWDPSPNFDWSKIGLSNHILLADLGKSPPSWAGYP